jgi:hypothetical protein
VWGRSRPLGQVPNHWPAYLFCLVWANSRYVSMRKISSPELAIIYRKVPFAQWEEVFGVISCCQRECA